MPSLLSYLARAAPRVLAQGQQGRLQGELLRRRAEEQQAERDALLQRETIRQSISNFNRVQGQQFQTNRDLRTRQYGEQQQQAQHDLALKDADTERQRVEAARVADLRGQAKAQGIMDADTLDAPTLTVQLGKKKREAEIADYGEKQKLELKYSRPPASAMTPGASLSPKQLQLIGAMQQRLGGHPILKNAGTLAEGVGKMRSAAQDPSAAGDLQMIFSYMKILDPTSAVRETEFANAQNAAGIPARVQNTWNKALKGERLNPEQRADFMNQAQSMVQSQRSLVKPILSQYENLARKAGLDPADVVLDPFGTLDVDEPNTAAPSPLRTATPPKTYRPTNPFARKP